ncbi:MAG: phage terminase large subunit family protein [Bacteroidales bacterium]|nr:phage terminase large subunit family protein [Bacteroidales bacterium]
MRRRTVTYSVPRSVLSSMPPALAAAIGVVGSGFSTSFEDGSCALDNAKVCDFEVNLSTSERRVIRKPARIPVSEWAEKYRVVTKSALPGPWRNETTPYLIGIMDASVVSCVETVIVVKPPQVGGTEIIHNFVGRNIDVDPGDALYVFPDDNLARENSKDRILPMIESSSRLRCYMTGKDDDVSTTRINLRHMTIYTASARSPSQLANKPIKYILFDEVDKYPKTTGKRETDPISLGRKRATTFGYGRKIWELSSPTIEQGPVWRAYQDEAQVRFVYLVKCPLCGKLQAMTTKQVKWDGGSEADPETVEATNAAWYECIECHGKWDDNLRNDATASGHWVAEDSGEELFAALASRRPKKIGFHLNALISVFVRISEYAAAFLKGMRDKTKMKDFRNGFEALPWVDYGVSREEDAILALNDDRPPMLVSDDADVLLATIDSQDNGFWYEVRAVKCGPALDSWGIAEGFVDSFEGLDKVLFADRYAKADGQELPIWKGMIDSQGHRTSEVYEWCSKHRQILPIKGEQTIKGAPVPPPTILERYPNTKRPIPGGLMLYRIDTNFFKDMLAGKLEINPADPGAWHMHSGFPKSHARHFTSEYINDQTGFWDCPPGKPNHLWDCAVYFLALCWFFGLRKEIRKTVKRLKSKPKTTNPYTGGASMFAGGR